DAGAAPDAQERVARMVKELTDEEHTLRFDSTQIGPGYELLTPAARQAIHDAGETEGLILDPVYGAKAFAGLAKAIASEEIQPGERTIYVHTGGLPGLFGHPFAQALAERTRE